MILISFFTSSLQSQGEGSFQEMCQEEEAAVPPKTHTCMHMHTHPTSLFPAFTPGLLPPKPYNRRDHSMTHPFQRQEIWGSLRKPGIQEPLLLTGVWESWERGREGNQVSCSVWGPGQMRRKWRSPELSQGHWLAQDRRLTRSLAFFTLIILAASKRPVDLSVHLWTWPNRPLQRHNDTAGWEPKRLTTHMGSHPVPCTLWS